MFPYSSQILSPSFASALLGNFENVSLYRRKCLVRCVRVHDIKQAVPPKLSVPFRSVHLASAVSDRYLDGSRVISIALKHSVHLASAVGTVLALNHCLENIPAGLTAPSRLYSYR